MSAVVKKTSRSSGRQRQWSAKIKALGKEARNEAIKKRIGVLESDNWDEEENARGNNAMTNDEDYVDDGGEDDSDFGEGKPSAAKRKKMGGGRTVATSAAKAKRFKAPPLKSLALALNLEQYDRYPSYIPTYLSIEAAPSKFPPRHFCYICGNSSNYQCPSCGLRFCKIRCDEEHRETRCLKFLA
jgi:zinc finger HIT domain-containing protein 1